jgi:hypothetical protein
MEVLSLHLVLRRLVVTPNVQRVSDYRRAGQDLELIPDRSVSYSGNGNGESCGRFIGCVETRPGRVTARVWTAGAFLAERKRQEKAFDLNLNGSRVT